MFQDPLTVRTRLGAAVQRPVDMLEPIPRAKYPAVTAEEERLAIPLQILCQAIFDAVIVHFMNQLSPGGSWQVVKSKICDALYRRKHLMTMEILYKRYSDVQVICLQEVAAVFQDTFQDSALAKTHELILPMKLDGKRDQNSLVLLRRDCFSSFSVKEVTALVATYMQSDLKLADGDLIAIEATNVKDGTVYLIVSFHGDTNGLLTIPMVRAVDQAVKQHFSRHVVILALDANVYEQEHKGRTSYQQFVQEATPLGFTTCWGDSPNVSLIRTTCSARTSLQPQLNKAVRHGDKIQMADKNPKDLIMFYKNQVQMVPANEMGRGRQPNPVKDNTGCLWYREESIFPTLEFPSDHGIVGAALQVIKVPAPPG